MFFSLVLLLVAILPLKGHWFWGSYIGDLTLSKYLGGACAVYAAVYAATHDGSIPTYLSTWQARCYLLLTILTYISYALTPITFSTISNPILTVTSLFLLYFVLLTVVDSMKRLRWIVLTTIASLAWASIYVIREWQKARGWETGYRPEWAIGDGNNFAIAGICALPLAWHLAQEKSRPGWERWLCWGCVLLTLVAVIVGASRGGLLGLVAAMLFMAARSRKRARNLVAVLVLLLGFNICYSHSPLRRLLHPDVNDTASSDNHLVSWQAGLKMVREHPVAGVGFGRFRSVMLKYAPDWYDGLPFQAHNAYISIAAEMGIPALFLFLGILIATYVSLEQTRRNKSVPRLITRTAVALQASLVGNCVAICFISAEYHQHLWLIVFLSMCLPRLATQFGGTHQRAFEPSDSTMEWVPAVSQVRILASAND